MPKPASREIFEGFIERSWRSNAIRQRNKGVEFVIGKRDGPYLWDIEGTRRVVDCGTGGGVHSLGHRHPEVLAALRQALDDGLDTGLWSFPNASYLDLQDDLARLAPDVALNRSVITHCSTLSVDVASAFAFRLTGRQKILAYRHGYHGHSGFAALVTGSWEEGILQHYNLPMQHADFFPVYGDLDCIAAKMDDKFAAVIIEPMNYETFAPASKEYLQGVVELCEQHRTIFILDETRSGLGRSGSLWAASQAGICPDILISGKGLSGGLYPVSALLMKKELYDRCMNEHKFSYISSLGGNELACRVARKVLEVSSRPDFLAHVSTISAGLRAMLERICRSHPRVFSMGTMFGAAATLEIRDPSLAPRLLGIAFEEGVLCHSISVIAPLVLKLLPPLTIDQGMIEEIGESLDRVARRVIA